MKNFKTFQPYLEKRLSKNPAHQANLWFRKPSVRWSWSHRKKKLRSSPGIRSTNEEEHRRATYSWRSTQNTSCCGEGWIWSIWQISQQRLPSLYHCCPHTLSFCAAKSGNAVKNVDNNSPARGTFCFASDPNDSRSPPSANNQIWWKKIDAKKVGSWPCGEGRRWPPGLPSQMWPTGSSPSQL